MRAIASIVVAAWIALVGVPAAAQPADVVVFAAASLKEALDSVAASWRGSTAKAVVISYAASSALARQIEQGAPAHLFISADLDWMDYVAERKLLKAGTRTNLLGNRIALIASTSSPVAAAVEPGFPLASLLHGGRLAMADVKAVPAGKYGKAALERLGVWNAVESRVAQAENVRAALLLVSRGEAPLGIVYRTDAMADPNVKVVDLFPEATHPPIVYPAALTLEARRPEPEAFLAYLRSDAARAVFVAKGFSVLD
jgi:molybdate transport system substrate-binding protein